MVDEVEDVVGGCVEGKAEMWGAGWGVSLVGSLTGCEKEGGDRSGKPDGSEGAL